MPTPTTELDPQGKGSSDDVLLEKIRERFDLADKGVHRKFRDKAERFYSLYRSYADWQDSRSAPRDRDVFQQAKRDWGAELFIPFSFLAVESTIPKMLARNPRVIIKPRMQQYEMNAPNMKAIIDAQYADIDYNLELQKIARDAFIYGLGVQKTYWVTSTQKSLKLAPRTFNSHEYASVASDYTLKDDPTVDWLDPFDFFWDPFAANMRTCEWVVQRLWRSTDQCQRMMDSGAWDHVDLEGAGGKQRYEEANQTRMRIDGYSGFRAPDTHEVWEYHDGESVITVLDRQDIVQNAPNPAWHKELPFQVYRPTPVSGRMVGIGEIEPIVALQEEMNTLRSQRRDNATISLQRSFFYMEGMIDPSDFKIGPGVGVPVAGEPGQVVMPMPISDIPNSGYQEEASLNADLMRTLGLQDGPQNTVEQTATGAQLQYQNLSERVKMKTRNLEVELVKGSGRQMLRLNQQKILTSRDVQVKPQPGQPDQRWAWMQVGPMELAGEFDLDVDGGSLAPENVPQQRSDAQAMHGLMQDGHINPQLGTQFVLRNMGIEDPEPFLQQPPPSVPQDAVENVFKALQGANVDPNLLSQVHAMLQPPPPAKK